MSYVFVDLTEDELAKLHALGGGSWIRLQVQAAPPPTSTRGLFGLSQQERQQLLADLPMLGRAATAKKYRVKPTAVDVLRRGAALTLDLRRRDARMRVRTESVPRAGDALH